MDSDNAQKPQTNQQNVGVEAFPETASSSQPESNKAVDMESIASDVHLDN
jgi:hypothetical protein